jgi:hypothetical protein
MEDSSTIPLVADPWALCADKKTRMHRSGSYVGAVSTGQSFARPSWQTGGKWECTVFVDARLALGFDLAG